MVAVRCSHFHPAGKSSTNGFCGHENIWCFDACVPFVFRCERRVVVNDMDQSGDPTYELNDKYHRGAALQSTHGRTFLRALQ
eukprot:1191252-Pyramimonas_sp.AAC.1